MGLFAKMSAVMGEVGFIKKRGRNTVQNYDYVMASDIAGEMAQLFAKHGVAFYPSSHQLTWETRESARGNAMYVCKAVIQYKLKDTESDEEILIPSFGEGIDNGDKAAYKAMTGALKYALIQTFLIAAGDDPEDETEDKTLKVPDTVLPESKPTGLPACPLCGAVGSIIKGRPEYGGGYLCYGKKGGCGARFKDDDTRIVDGKAKEREVITPEQLTDLEALCSEFNVSAEAVIAQYRASDPAVKTLADLTPSMFKHALDVFEKKRTRQLKLN